MSARVRTHYLLLGLAVLLLPLAYVGVSEARQSWFRPGSGDSVAASSLGVGDCFELPAEDQQVTVVRPQSCEDPHDAEVYARFELSGAHGSVPPADEKISTEAHKGCTNAFTGFVGRPFDSTTQLRIFLLRPYQRSWSSDPDHAVRCAVYDPGGQVTVPTLRGANR